MVRLPIDIRALFASHTCAIVRRNSLRLASSCFRHASAATHRTTTGFRVCCVTSSRSAISGAPRPTRAASSACGPDTRQILSTARNCCRAAAPPGCTTSIPTAASPRCSRRCRAQASREQTPRTLNLARGLLTRHPPPQVPARRRPRQRARAARLAGCGRSNCPSRTGILL
jgi:hypothetical protein